jgi:hypothetical protein
MRSEACGKIWDIQEADELGFGLGLSRTGLWKVQSSSLANNDSLVASDLLCIVNDFGLVGLRPMRPNEALGTAGNLPLWHVSPSALSKLMTLAVNLAVPRLRWRWQMQGS